MLSSIAPVFLGAVYNMPWLLIVGLIIFAATALIVVTEV